MNVKKQRLDAATEILVSQNLAVNSCAKVPEFVSAITSADDIERQMSLNDSMKFNEFNFDKGEFETTTDFNERIALYLRVFFGQPGLVAFKAPLPAELATYSADDGKLTVRIVNRGSFQSTSYDANLELVLAERSKKLALKHGQTRMGVKFDYEVWAYYDRKLELSLPVKDTDVNSDVVIDVPPSDAKALKANLFLLSFGDMKSPYMESSQGEDPASLDDPEYALYSHDIYYASPKCLFLYDSRSGKVLHSFIPYETTSTD